MEALTMERPETVALTFKSQVEQGLEEYHGDTDNQEYRQLRNAFFYSSKRSMSQHISKFIE